MCSFIPFVSHSCINRIEGCGSAPRVMSVLARFNSFCVVCRNPVTKGERVVRCPTGQWIHIACADRRRELPEGTKSSVSVSFSSVVSEKGLSQTASVSFHSCPAATSSSSRTANTASSSFDSLCQEAVRFARLRLAEQHSSDEDKKSKKRKGKKRR